MRGWRIDVDGVRAVLASVVVAGESLSVHESDLALLRDESPTAFGPAHRLGNAFGRVLDLRSRDVAAAAVRARRVLTAASEATEGYVAADEDMAAEAQSSAASAFAGVLQ